ncbi:MAG: hypothetical protein ABI333_17930 [bacterium]
MSTGLRAKTPCLLLLVAASVIIGGVLVGGCGDDDGGPGVDCGNGVAEGTEQCDTYDLRGATCGSLIPGSSGVLSCLGDCTFNSSNCQFSSCGDGVANGSEACDGADLRGQTCADVVAGSSGVLACTATCAYDASGCAVGQCGDDVAEGAEECDLTDLRGQTCGDVVAGTSGTLGCTSSCLYDTTGCEVAMCGNGVAEGAEQCDQLDLNGQACADVVPGSIGSLACTTSCTFETSGCDTQYCGNGIADGAEECDLFDLQSQTCADVLAGSTGTLSCSAACTYVTAGCVLCGDGIRNFGEACDCGTDPANLPAGCMDVNGGANANCTATCQKIVMCGDGVVDVGEDCDCGTDPANLPAGCVDVNGGPASACTATCSLVIPCNHDVWEDCDPLVTGDCCPDDWGVQLQCSTLPIASADTVCMRHCTDSLDCYWSNWCLGPQFGDLCWPAVCAPGGDIDTGMNELCQVPGGGQGWCSPIFSRSNPTQDFVGWCAEAGTAAHGQTCPNNPFDTTDRSELQCNLGFCLAPQGAPTGTCAQFCDWEAAYAVAIYGAAAVTEVLPCPAGANCFSESSIDSVTGLRSGDVSHCADTEAVDPTNGTTTCSLITNQLLSNPAQTCADTHTDGRCVMIQFSSGDVTNGSLVGVCTDDSAPNLAVWADCDPSNTAQVCPAGTICVNEDIFAVTPVGQERCMPYCDTAHHDGVQATCQGLGAGAGATCTTQSWLYGTPGQTDIHPTRLGLCAL